MFEHPVHRFETKEEAPKKRLVSIESGGDWHDADYDLLDVPTTIDLATEKEAWRQWYAIDYLPRLRVEQKPEYKTFVQWLIERGATRPRLERFGLDPNS